MPVTTVASAPELVSALLVARPGDTIALAPGDYGAVSLSKLDFSAPVTITSQDVTDRATITGLNVTDSSGLTFRNLVVVSDPADGGYPNVVNGSSNISFDAMYFHGSLNGDPSDDTGGLQIRGSSDVTITGSEFEQLFWGISHLSDSRLTISGNDFHDLRMDGIRGGGSSYITISSNSFRDFFINTGDHGDVIQFWTTNTTVSAHDISIVDNVFIRGAGYFVQGIGLRDDVGAVPYEHVVISGNLLAGSTYNAITVGHAADLMIADNTVQAFADHNSYIRVTNIDGLTLTNNASPLVRVLDSSAVTETGTTILQPVSDAGAAALGAWTTDHMVTVLGGPEDDVLFGAATGTILRGAEGNDFLRGGANFDDINGNQGDDTAFGGAGDDWVVGGKGDDSLAGDAGNDIVYGNLGADTCEGGAGNDTVRGGQDNDVVRGGDGDDFLSGDRGYDTMTGGAGADIFHASADTGVDWVTDFNPGEGDRVMLDPGTAYSVVQAGADTAIYMASGAQVLLLGVSMSSLSGDWLIGA